LRGLKPAPHGLTAISFGSRAHCDIGRRRASARVGQASACPSGTSPSLTGPLRGLKPAPHGLTAVSYRSRAHCVIGRRRASARV